MTQIKNQASSILSAYTYDPDREREEKDELLAVQLRAEEYEKEEERVYRSQLAAAVELSKQAEIDRLAKSLRECQHSFKNKPVKEFPYVLKLLKDIKQFIQEAFDEKKKMLWEVKKLEMKIRVKQSMKNFNDFINDAAESSRHVLNVVAKVFLVIVKGLVDRLLIVGQFLFRKVVPCVSPSSNKANATVAPSSYANVMQHSYTPNASPVDPVGVYPIFYQQLPIMYGDNTYPQPPNTPYPFFASVQVQPTGFSLQQPNVAASSTYYVDPQSVGLFPQ